MACGCANDKKLDETKRLSLESMKTLSIDEIINLYRQGYRLDNVDSGLDIPKIDVPKISRINTLTYNTQCSGSPELAFNNTSVLQGTFGAVRKGRVWAQRFYGNFRCLDTVEFNMLRSANVNFYIEIRKDDGVGEGKPLGVPLVDDSGLILRTSSIPYTDIPTSSGWVLPYVATILPTNAFYWICFVPVDFYDSPIYRDIAHDRFWLQDGTNIADKRSAVFENGGWTNSSTFAFALFKLPTFIIPSNAQVWNMCWGPGLGAQCSIPPEHPVVTLGTTVTIKADIANSGSTGPVRAVFKINGNVISDQNTPSLATFTSNQFWSPTTTYMMSSSNVTLTVDGYGWDGSTWILTNTQSATISATTPTCTGISFDAIYVIPANVGDIITLTAGVTPTTQAFTVNFIDRSNNVLGTCTTLNGMCSSQWNTTGLAPGQYYITAVTGLCYSPELVIGLSLPIRQWNVDITVLDNVTSSPIPGAYVTIGVRTLQTDTNGYVRFTGVDEGTINVGITKTGYNDSLTNPESLYNNITRIYRMIPVSQNPGSLRFMTSPPGIIDAEVHFIGDVPTLKGRTDANGIFPIGSLTAGRVINYEVRKTTYNTATGSVTVVGNITTDVLVTMTLLSITGSVCIHSNPFGASIKIDTTPQVGKSTALSGGGCVTANTIDNLPSGSHNYELSLTGYQNKTGSFSINVGQTLDYDAGALTPLPTLGTLNISSNPSGARIYIKTGGVYQDTGYATGTTGTPTVITTLVAGMYEYKLVLVGYNDYLNTFDIIVSQTTTIDVMLNPICSSMSDVVPNPSTIVANNPVTLSTNVSPAGIYTVEFFNADTPTEVFVSKTETTSTTTYSTTWIPTTTGTYHIKARIGIQCSSTNPITVIVNPAGQQCTSISNVTPNPTTVNANNPVTLSTTVSPAGIYTVEFFNADTPTEVFESKTETTSTTTYSTTWIPTTTGTYHIKARIGIQCSSTNPITVTVNPSIGVTCVSITTPIATPSSISEGSSTTLSTTVTPSETTSQEFLVQFMEGTTQIGSSVTTINHVATKTWNPSAGTHNVSTRVGTECASPGMVQITVSTVQAAGAGGAMMIAAVVAIGLAYYMTKKPPKLTK